MRRWITQPATAFAARLSAESDSIDWFRYVEKIIGEMSGEACFARPQYRLRFLPSSIELPELNADYVRRLSLSLISLLTVSSSSR